MKKKKLHNSLTHGYILLDSLIAVLIISAFILSFAGLYSSIIRLSVRQEAAYLEYLAANNELFDTEKFVYCDE